MSQARRLNREDASFHPFASSSSSASSLSPTSPASSHSRSAFTPRLTTANPSGGGSDRTVFSNSLIPRDYLAQSRSNASSSDQTLPVARPVHSSSSPSDSLPQSHSHYQFPSPKSVDAPPVDAVPSQPSDIPVSATHSGSPVSPVSPVSPTATTTRVGRSPDRDSVSPLPSNISTRAKPPQSSVVPESARGAAAGHMSKTPSQEQLRKDAGPGVAPVAPTSQSMSTSASSPAVASAIPDSSNVRKLPRTSSIDSAISSLSRTSHSQNPSLDANTVTPADIANVIATAGSAEAVIIHLLKEKQHAANQNAQLWKLVDKQRTMVFGLNKDLERAMKEKEKYKKKLNELQTMPSVPSRRGETGGASPQNDKGNTAAIATSEKSENGSSPAVSPEKPLPQDESPRGVQKSATAPALVHQGSTQKQQQQNGSSRAARDMSESSRSTPSDIRRTEQLLLDQDRPESNLSDYQSRTTKQAAPSQQQSVKPSNANPANSTNAEITPSSNPPPTAPPGRRPPPAPLNIDDAERARPNIEVESREHDSESEYEEILADDEIPSFERGRRKTREEDDRKRVALMLQEQETRSQSNKKKAKNIDPPTKVQQEQAHGFRGMGLPASPRATLSGQPSPVPGGLRPRSPPEPMSSFLSPIGSETSSTEKSQSLRSPAMSPGLPHSPRPGDRPPGAPVPRRPPHHQGSLASPPTSPKSVPTPAPAPAPNSPLPPVPSGPPGPAGPHSPVDSSGPPSSKTNGQHATRAHNEHSTQNVPTIDSSVQIDSPSMPRNLPGSIYRGLMSDEHPNLLLSPNALPSIDIKVSSSRLRPSRNSYLGPKPVSEEDPVFTLSVISRANRAELWRVEKGIMTLPQLDQQMKQLSNFSFKLPERSIFSGHSPAKVDARRAALNAYFEALLDTPMDETAAVVVCKFLTADAIEPRDNETSLVSGRDSPKTSVRLGPDGKPKMEGYLTKRGKNFGGWKSRYFVLSGPELKYYEDPGGPHMGTIKLRHAQIGKQSHSSKNQPPSQNDDDSENQYRHAFLVLEPKKKDSNALVRHVLCAESDEERDAWVETLLAYVEENISEDEAANKNQKPKPDVQPKSQPHPKPRALPGNVRRGSKDAATPEPEQTETLRAFSYDDVSAAEAPVRGGAISSIKHAGPAASNSISEHDNQHPTSFDQMGPMSPTLRTISGPTNGVKIQDAGAWGNRIPATNVKEKKRSIWGFRAQSSAELANIARQDSIGSGYTESVERKEHVRPVFGLPLAEAVEFCGPRGVENGLPAVVYRCIEYLRAQHAEAEEGIFRLSGSNVVIKSLKERFNTEGDFDFRDGDRYYDVHAVASLFKQYLRELPTTVLTRELHLDFIHVLDLEEKEQKIAAFHVLVRRLPQPNLTLLKALSQFLIVIVNNSDINKMTVRNVGIVFAPTLNIPAPVFSMFLMEYDLIFSDDPPAWLAKKTVKISPNKPLGPDDIRSPRHQTFSDLPTPAYSSFPTPGRETPDSATAPGESGPRDRRESHNVSGFVPFRPTYEQPAYGGEVPQQQQQNNRSRQGDVTHSQYGSMNGMLAPNSSQNPRGKRRESSTLFMGKGSRKSSMPVIRDEQSMVSEDSAFE